MLQVATFTLPDQQNDANEFLTKHRPSGPVNFNRDMIIVFYDDGKTSPEVEADSWQEFLTGAEHQRQDLEIALYVMEAERADLNAKRNKPRFDELTSAISEVKGKLDNLELKCDYVKSRIANLLDLNTDTPDGKEA